MQLQSSYACTAGTKASREVVPASSSMGVEYDAEATVAATVPHRGNAINAGSDDDAIAVRR